jgi:hypothetical protein
MFSPPPIDAVYTWVDGTRPDYLALVQKYSVIPRDLNPERFRDPFQMLRYSLRSLERYAPWVRHVYLLTCRPQVPAWLRTEHPRLRIVHHDEVGDPAALPTFNSNIIETFLHRLPGVSEHFLYFNDDYFLGAPVAPADFYTADGRIKVCGTWVGERLRARVYEHQVLSFGLLEHAPRLIDRGRWAEMQSAAPEAFANPQAHRFRSPTDVRPERFYNWHLLTHARKRVAVEPFWRFLREAKFLKLRDRPAELARQFARLAAARPKFFCLNDDLGPRPSAAAVTAVRAFLAAQFPTPSVFENPGSSPSPPPAQRPAAQARGE